MKHTELLGFWNFPLSSILENREHNVSETGSVPSSGEGGKTPTQLGPLERAFPPHLRTETDPVSEMSYFSVF
jgi:hypothetical protein